MIFNIFKKLMNPYILNKIFYFLIFIIIVSIPFIVILSCYDELTKRFKNKFLYMIFSFSFNSIFFFIFIREGNSIIMSLFMSIVVNAAFLLIIYYFIIVPIKILLYFIKKIINFFKSKTKNKENDSTHPYSCRNVSIIQMENRIFLIKVGFLAEMVHLLFFSDSTDNSDLDGNGGDGNDGCDGGSDGGDGGGDGGD